jgi:hypothetical protein
MKPLNIIADAFSLFFFSFDIDCSIEFAAAARYFADYAAISIFRYAYATLAFFAA